MYYIFYYSLEKISIPLLIRVLIKILGPYIWNWLFVVLANLILNISSSVKKSNISSNFKLCLKIIHWFLSLLFFSLRHLVFKMENQISQIRGSSRLPFFFFEFWITSCKGKNFDFSVSLSYLTPVIFIFYCSLMDDYCYLLHFEFIFYDW